MNNDLNISLAEGEKIIWYGYPNTKKKLTTQNSNVGGLAIWTSVIVALAIITRLISGDWKLMWYFVPFFLFSIFGFISYFVMYLKENGYIKISNNKEDKYFHYYISNKRIIITVSSKYNKSLCYINFADLSNFHYDHNNDGIGNLYSSTSIINSPFTNSEICMENVSNVMQLYKMIIPYLNTSQISKSFTASFADDPISDYISIEGEIVNNPKHAKSYTGMVTTVANTMNMPTIILIMSTAIFMCVVYFFLENSYALLIKSAPFIILAALVLIYQIFTRMHNKK